MLAFLLILASAGAAIAHPPTLGSRIHGGEKTPIQSRPYQVSLHSSSGRFFCGGSIVDKNHVVTAAHCVTPELKLAYVRAGSSYENRGGRVHYVNASVHHEKFYINKYKNAGYDVAVLRVNESFVYDNATQPIELFRPNEKSTAGVEAVVSGWGRLENNALPDHLQSVAIPIVNSLTCNVAYKPVGGLDVGQICAGYYGVGKKSPCSGDSGGPLTIQGRLAGIVSYCEGCGEPFYPAVFAEVAYFNNWILKNVNKI